MKWERGHKSANVDDLRGGGGGGGRGPRRPVQIGIVGILLLLGASAFLGQDLVTPFLTGGAVDMGASAGGGAGSSPEQDEQVQFVSFVLDDAQATWTGIFQRGGQTYPPARLRIFANAVETGGCGPADAGVGPFYCPADRNVYIDLTFFQELRTRFNAEGDFAQAYVVAHEIGHHVQNVLGVEQRVRRGQAQNPAAENDISVRMELQADCFAGVWAHSTNQRRLLEAGDVEEAMRAAAAVGDDTLQRQAGRRVRPESFTHGSSEQRMRWFRQGMTTGDMNQCDTFSVATP